jgi:hypothetical protein
MWDRRGAKKPGEWASIKHQTVNFPDAYIEDISTLSFLEHNQPNSWA